MSCVAAALAIYPAHVVDHPAMAWAALSPAITMFLRAKTEGEPCLASIDSLRLDIENDEYDFSSELAAESKIGGT
jgi:hypothetical protein